MKYNIKTLLIIIVTLTIYRILLVATSDITLYADEAQYWTWAKNLDWGYYSKPPMIAWIIACTTSLFGDSVLAVKLGAILIYPLTITMIYLLANRLFDTKIAWWSAVTFMTLPAVSMSSVIISTDVVLIFFWASSLYYFHRAIHENRLKWWLLLGIFSGFGLLSKYSFIIFALSAVIIMIQPLYRHLWKEKGVYITIILAFLLFLPNILWNAHHHFVSFMHTKEISQVERELFHPERLAEFLGSQFAVFGLILFGWYIFIIATSKKWWNIPNYRYLFLMSFPFLAFISFQSVISRAMMNWAAPTYVAATILVVAWLFHHNKLKWLYWGIALNITMAMIFYHYHTLTHLFSLHLSSKQDPYKRVMGWDKLGERVKIILEQYPDSLLLSYDRKELVTLIYTTQAKEYVIWNPTQRLQNHYDLTTTMNDKIGRNAVLVYPTSEVPEAIQHFEGIRYKEKISIPLYKDFNLSYDIYVLENFKGY